MRRMDSVYEKELASFGILYKLSTCNVAQFQTDSFSKHILGFLFYNNSESSTLFHAHGKTFWKMLSGCTNFTLPISCLSERPFNYLTTRWYFQELKLTI